MKFINRIVTLVLLLPMTLSLSAQGVLEEVVVTAQKREQSLQEVPISVTALSGDQMEALGISDFTEVTQQMPNVQINAWSPKLTIFNLRGVSQNNFQDNLEAPVAVYVDDVYMASMNGISGQLFDMKRVEVLRGPQGTLFGRNATGGLIHYLSQDASDEETNGYLEAEYGNFDRKVFEGAVGGSFTDNVRYRLAGRWNEQDGYIKGVDTILPGTSTVLFPGSGQDIGGIDGYAIRGTVQVDFSEQLQGNFWLKYSEDNNIPTGGYVFENCALDANGLCPIDAEGRAITSEGVIDLFGQPTSPHLNYGDAEGFMNREKFDVTGRFDYELSNGMQLASITNYNTMEYDYIEDGDALAVPILTFLTFIPDYTQFSQEIRLSGETDRMRWQTGFYYLDVEIDGGTSVTGAPAFGQNIVSGKVVARGGVDTSLATANPFNGFEGADLTQDYVLNSKNWSIFGQVEYDISDRLTGIVGIRWSQDDKNIDWQTTFTDNFNPTALVIESSAAFAATNAGVDDIDYGDWAGRFALHYDVNDNLMVFGSANRGIKGGNWSLGGSTNITADTFKHKEEVLWSYEAGFKSTHDNFRLNGTFYYYDYEDYQAFSLAGGGAFIRNTGASAYGGELEAFWSPDEHWDVAFGAGFSDSEIDEVFGSQGVLAGGLISGPAITDAEFPNAPAVSLNYLVRYNWNMFKGNLALQVDGAYYGDQFLEVTNGSGTEQKAYNVSNARLTYTDDAQRFSISAWVKNFTDEEYKLYSLDLGTLGVTTYYAPPITYGITGRYNF